MRVMKYKKDSGCSLEVIVFDNGKVAAPEVAIYDNIALFEKVRTPSRGYNKVSEVYVP